MACVGGLGANCAERRRRLVGRDRSGVAAGLLAQIVLDRGSDVEGAYVAEDVAENQLLLAVDVSRSVGLLSTAPSP